ncbi:MAG: helix-turn-helix transcriptional regulator [Vulcanimicrobiota bacterium]
MIMSHTLSQRISHARKECKLSMKELAENIGVSEQAIFNAETERRTVTAVMLFLIANATGRPLEWFFQDFQEKPEDTSSEVETDIDPIEINLKEINKKLDRLVSFVDKLQG